MYGLVVMLSIPRSTTMSPINKIQIDEQYQLILNQWLKCPSVCHYQQRDLIKFCNQFDIHVTAYSSLGTTTPSNGDTNELLKDPVVTKISQAKNLSNAQVLLLWALQKGLSVVPKSTNPQHIAENINLNNSSLTDEEIELLDTIDLNKKYAWNADKVL